MGRYAVFVLLLGVLPLGGCNPHQEEPRAITVRPRPVASVTVSGDSLLLLVTGEGGEILRTTDGGETWERSQGHPGEQFRQVCLIDSLNGWAATDQGAIKRTTDGGASWLTIGWLKHDDSLASVPVLEHMVFIDNYSGWIVDPLWIWHTEDGGTSWFRQELDLSEPEHIAQLTVTDFVDSKVGWAAGTRGALFETTDGGNSWSRRPPVCATDIAEMLFRDRAHGWVAATTSGIFGTENGGGDWFEANLPTEPVARGDEMLVRSISFPSNDEGWAGGTVQGYDAESRFHSRGILVHTVDGGHTWVEVPVGLEERIFDVVRFTGPLVGWLVGGSGKVYHTADAGKSWKVVLELPAE